jgi:serine/threonine-protein kinase
MGHLENYIETLSRELGEFNDEYLDLYLSVNCDSIRSIFSTFHEKLIALFKSMNSRLPTEKDEAHFWADPSRELIFIIEKIEGLQRILKNTAFSFSLVDTYKKIVEKCKIFLSPSGGSTIPLGVEKIELYYTMPIFIQNNVVAIKRRNEEQNFNLELIGEGSYAHVFKYKDDHYQRFFVIKRAKKVLTEKELIRFQQEYQAMKDLHSPYVVDVYGYNQNANEYTMEFIDYTLCDYIEKYRNGLTHHQRRSICNQILRAFAYIHSKELLHRDISPTNILIKEYDDLPVVKISDFGLVKIRESQLTSDHTELKGGFNDPSLKIEGFNNYNIKHEIYSLTIMLCFVMSGTTNISNIKDPRLAALAPRGMNPDKSLRFGTVFELKDSFNAMYSKENNH